MLTYKSPSWDLAYELLKDLCRRSGKVEFLALYLNFQPFLLAICIYFLPNCSGVWLSRKYWGTQAGEGWVRKLYLCSHWEATVHAGYRLFHAASRGSPMFFPVTTHLCSIHKFNTLTCFPVGGLMELCFGLSSSTYEERIDFKSPQWRNSWNRR